MAKHTPLQKKLQDILSQKNFDELESFKSTKSWKTLDPADRDLLASLFVMLGQKQLEQGDKNAQESFDLAAKIAPENADIFYKIGTAYSIPEFNMPCLKNAEDAFRKALKLNPHHFATWVTLGNLYNSIGLITHDYENFDEALHCYQESYELCPKNNREDLAQLYWNWAQCYYSIAKHSGEAVDFFSAREKFHSAAHLGLQDKRFWSNYGDTLAELSELITRPDLYIEVVELYRNAVRLDVDWFEGWLSLGCAFQVLFEIYGTDEYYYQASESFKMASQIKEEHAFLWIKWAHLTALGAKKRQDLNLLKESFEKYAKADACEPNNAQILGLWGEVLLLYGAQTENIDCLRNAQAKIARSLEIEPSGPETWYIYGCCQYEFGRYFAQEDYFLQAIDKFQFGLTIKQSEPLLWYGLAITYYALGDLKGDISFIEKAVSLFPKVIEFKGQSYRPLWNDWGIALMKLADMTGDSHYVESAIEKFEHVIPTQPEQWDDNTVDPEWLYNYGCALDLLGDLSEEASAYEKSIQALAKAVQIDPDYGPARYNLALALAHLGELVLDVECFHKSIEQFQILLSHDSEDEQGWCDYGVTLVHLGQLIHDPARPDQVQKLYEIAESKFVQAIALGSTQAYYSLACLYALQGNFDSAMHFLERAEAAGALPCLADLMHDEWLDDLRETIDFKQFMAHLSAKKFPDRAS